MSHDQPLSQDLPQCLKFCINGAHHTFHGGYSRLFHRVGAQERTAIGRWGMSGIKPRTLTLACTRQSLPLAVRQAGNALLKEPEDVCPRLRCTVNVTQQHIIEVFPAPQPLQQ